jgi:hypothetical protein
MITTENIVRLDVKDVAVAGSNNSFCGKFYLLRVPDGCLCLIDNPDDR